MLRTRFPVFAACLLACCCFETRAANPADLNRRLSEIGLKLLSQSPDFSALETEYLDLLKTYKSPEEQGRIYYALAVMFAQQAQQHLPKVAEYCEQALKRPLGTLEKIQMYIYWGDALWMKYSAAPAEELVPVRTQIVSLYLNGFKLVLDHQTTDDAGRPPLVTVYHYFGPSDAEYAEATRRNEMQMKARREWDLQHRLILFHPRLVEHIVSVYTRKPHDEAELKKLADEILQNPAGVKEILKRYQEVLSAK